MDEGTRPVNVLVKAIQVLRALADSHTPLGPTELSRLTGLDRSAVHRILATFARERLVTRVGENGTYQLGSDLIALGLVAASRLDLRRVARPHLESLFGQVSETVNLSTLDRDAALCIDMIEARHGLRMSGSIGSRDSLVTSSLGKAILAFLPAERQDQLVAVAPLASATPNSIQNREQLRYELELTRERGYALDNEENELGVCCVGAPILGFGGDVLGAISASIPTVRFAPERRSEVVAAVVGTAERISSDLVRSTPALLPTAASASQ